MTADPRSDRPDAVVVEADGGSRGNPGQAAYGAVLKDAVTGEVLAERGERIGVATNNVAEYSGLIAGLELYREHADGADLEVRLDSKLVIEQMRGAWKIKHPSMKPLALQANRLAPPGTTYTWVPREQNKHADRLANEALDSPDGVSGGAAAPREAVGSSEDQRDQPTAIPRPPWELGPPTTLILIRHGETSDTRSRRFSGRDGADPGLSEDGRAQIRDTVDWLAPLAEQSPVLLSSPMRRTRESADILSARFEASYRTDEGLLEASFGTWEGLTYAEVLERDPDAFKTWFGDFDHRAGGTGDSMTHFAERMEATRTRLLDTYPGQTVVATTHLTPIKMLTRQVLDMPMTSLFRTEISPASVTVLAWYPDGRPVCRLLNGQPAGHVYADGFTVR